MGLLVAVAYVIGYAGIMGSSFLVILLLHEMGHALAALMFTARPITVYVGSYGRSEGNWAVTLGRLQLHIKRRLIAWRGGCCYYQPIASVWKNIVIVLAGPLLPLLLASSLFYVSMQCPNSIWRLILLVFAFFAFSSCLQNLLRGNQIYLANGQRIKSDGLLIREYLRQPGLRRLAEQANHYAEAGQYAACARAYEALLKQAEPTAALRRNLISSHWLAGQLPAALAASQHFEQEAKAEFDDGDRFTRATLLSRLGQHQQALAGYSALIEQETPYPDAYNNRGYTQNLLGNYVAALADFDQAIAREASVAYAHNNRGLAYLRLGREAEGLADIAHGLQLDPTNAYGYRNLGIYHLDRGEYAVALGQFERARQLDPHTHDLDGYLQQTRQQLAENSTAGG